MATYKHLRSSTANKRPTTGIADGQLAINTNTASPGLFFKDSAGTGIVKVGPVHVGTTAPNATPAAGGSSGNYTGEQWLDTSVSPAQMKVWNGSAWVGVVADELPVSKLQDGAARQLLQTDAAGTGVEWTSNVDVPGTLDVTGATTLDSTLTVPLGSAASPTLRFSGDANSGLYSPGADQVAVATNGTGRLFVDASGNVGVGTGSPASILEANATVSGSNFIGIRCTDSTNTKQIQIFRTGSSYSYGGIGGIEGALFANSTLNIVADSNGSIKFNTGNAPTERLRITSAGLVGIGTSSPSEALHVKSTSGTQLVLERDGTTTQIASVVFKDGSGDQNRISSSDSNLIFESGAGNTERLRIDSSGRVGIGTTSPSELITGRGNIFLETNSTSANSGAGLFWQSTTSGWTSAGAHAAIYGKRVDGNNGYLRFDTRSGGTTAERARIDSAGRVGIGTTSPGAKVHGAGLASGGVGVIWDSAAGGSRIEYKDNNNRRGYFLWDTNSLTLAADSGNSLKFSTNAGVTQHATIDSSGRLLVGTSTYSGGTRAVFRGNTAAPGTQGVIVLQRDGANPGTTQSLGEIRFVDSNDGFGASISATPDGGWSSPSDCPTKLVFSTTADGTSSPTERMRINNRGHLLCGTTTDNTNQARVTVAPGPGSYNPDAGADLWKNCAVAGRGSFGGGLAVIQASGDGYTFYAAGTPSTLRVRYGADGGTATSNGVNLTSTATSWSANSDERLKTDLIPIEAGLEKASSLRAVTGRYLTDEEGVSRAFLIAQDVQAVLPEAVDQEGDEIGTLSLRYTEVIPLLVAALKESKERIETLEAKVAALESA
jgi:hypothetical protein